MTLNPTSKMSISTLRLPLASSRLLLLRQNCHRLPLSNLRFFSTSPQDDAVSTYASKFLTTKKKFAKAVNHLASQLPPPPGPPPPQVVSADESQVLSPCMEEVRVSPSMEVFDIHVQRFDAKRHSRIYGTVGCTALKSFFYNRPITNPESVHLGLDPLRLTGPERPFTAQEPFEIDIDIKDADTDTEIIRGSLSWSTGSPGDCNRAFQDEEEEKEDSTELGKGYNRFIREKFLGKHGSAMISYAVFDKAVSATIEVVLLNGAADVHGVVAASNTFLSMGHSVLFHREKRQKVSVIMPGELVPLSRSVVALPADSDLDVRVELWNCDGDEEMASATATFEHSRGSARSSKIISGQIKVTVTWTTC